MWDEYYGHLPKSAGVGLIEVGMPVGSVTAFAGEVMKHKHTNKHKVEKNPVHSSHPIEAWGWMICDGRELHAEAYPELFAALGYLYGGSDFTFFLPDMQGLFLRGIAPPASKSPPPEPYKDIYASSHEQRVAAKNGHSTGVGSIQMDAMQTHKHTYKMPKGATSGNSGTGAIPKEDGFTGAPTNDSKKEDKEVKVSPTETRGANIFVYYLIKYTNHLPAIKREFFHSKL